MDFLYYFAYGSNINPTVLELERRVRPLERIVAHIKNYTLIFNVPGIRYLEPAFANIEKSYSSNVWGICYKITVADFEKIRATEGKAYDIVELEVYSAQSIQPISAVVFISRNCRSSIQDILLPTKRYLELIISGAVHYKLPTEYVDSLINYKYFYIPILSDAFTFILKFIKPVLFFLQRNGVQNQCKD